MDSITSNLPALVLIVAGVGLAIMLVMQAMQISQLRQRIDMLTRGVNGESLEGVLDAHLELVHQVSEDLDELTARTETLEGASAHHYGRVGLVRFNPFPDTGGNQSFALAMLDESDDGWIVSSLHSRTGTRIYAKAVTAGKADNTLSNEEAEAIDMARSRKGARSSAAARPAPRPMPAPSRPAAARVVEPEPEPALPPRGRPAPARPAPTPTYEPEPEPEAEPAVAAYEPAYAEPDDAVAPAPKKGGFRGLFSALKPGGTAPEPQYEEEEALPEIAEPPAGPAPVAAAPSAGSDRKTGAAGQSKAAAGAAADEDYDPDRTGRRPGSIGR